MSNEEFDIPEVNREIHEQLVEACGHAFDDDWRAKRSKRRRRLYDRCKAVLGRLLPIGAPRSEKALAEIIRQEMALPEDIWQVKVSLPYYLADATAYGGHVSLLSQTLYGDVIVGFPNDLVALELGIEHRAATSTIPLWRCRELAFSTEVRDRASRLDTF